MIIAAQANESLVVYLQSDSAVTISNEGDAIEIFSAQNIVIVHRRNTNPLQIAFDNTVVSAYLLDDSTSLIAWDIDGVVVLSDARTGIEIWRTQLPLGANPIAAVSDGAGTYFIIDASGVAFSISRTDDQVSIKLVPFLEFDILDVLHISPATLGFVGSNGSIQVIKFGANGAEVMWMRDNVQIRKIIGISQELEAGVVASTTDNRLVSINASSFKTLRENIHRHTYGATLSGLLEFQGSDKILVYPWFNVSGDPAYIIFETLERLRSRSNPLGIILSANSRFVGLEVDTGVIEVFDLKTLSALLSEFAEERARNLLSEALVSAEKLSVVSGMQEACMRNGLADELQSFSKFLNKDRLDDKRRIVARAEYYVAQECKTFTEERRAREQLSRVSRLVEREHFSANDYREIDSTRNILRKERILERDLSRAWIAKLLLEFNAEDRSYRSAEKLLLVKKIVSRIDAIERQRLNSLRGSDPSLVMGITSNFMGNNSHISRSELNSLFEMSDRSKVISELLSERLDSSRRALRGVGDTGGSLSFASPTSNAARSSAPVPTPTPAAPRVAIIDPTTSVNGTINPISDDVAPGRDKWPRNSLYTRRNNQFGTRSERIDEAVRRGVLVDQEIITFDDFVGPDMHTIKTPTDGSTLGAAVGVAAIPENLKRESIATHLLEVILRTPDAPTPGQTPARTAVNYVFVVDRSSSMSREPLDIVKQTVLKIYENLGPNDALGIIAFDDQVETVLPATRVSNINKTDLVTRIRSIVAGGGTDLNLGIGFGFDEFARFDSLTRSNQLIILTDGQPTSGETEWYRIRQNVLENLKREPAQLIGLAIGSGADFNEMDALVGTSGGRAEAIVRLTDIEAVIGEEVTRQAFMAALGIEVLLKLNDAVGFRYFYGHTPVDDASRKNDIKAERDAIVQDAKQLGVEVGESIINDDNVGVRLFVPNLAYGESYILVFELAIPDTETLPQIGDLTVKYVDVPNAESRRIEYGINEASKDIDYSTIISHAMKLASSELVYASLDSVRNGQNSSANVELQAHAERLTTAAEEMSIAVLRDDAITLRQFSRLLSNSLKPRVLQDQKNTTNRSYVFSVSGRSVASPVLPHLAGAVMDHWSGLNSNYRRIKFFNENP